MARKPTVRVIVVEPHAVVREGITRLLESEPGLSVCAGASDFASALAAIAKHTPRLAIIDTNLRNGNGLELIRLISTQYPRLATIVLTAHDERLYAEPAMRAGAKGYVMKTESFETVRTAIYRVLENDIYLSQSVSSQIVRQQLSRSGSPRVLPAELLSDRERQVFQLISEWKATREIAQNLHLSIKTVEYYVGKIKEKLQIRNAKELLQFAITMPDDTSSTKPNEGCGISRARRLKRSGNAGRRTGVKTTFPNSRA